MNNETRPRKYYEITEQGKAALVVEKEQWLQVNSVLNEIWQLKPTPSLPCYWVYA